MEIVGAIALTTALAGGGIATLGLVAGCYRKVDQGKALIINTTRNEPAVTFTGGVVYPVIHRAEIMDISVKAIALACVGKDGIICRDDIRADIEAVFFVRVNPTVEDVLKVARAVGCERASKQETLEELFATKFLHALQEVGRQFDFEDLYARHREFADRIIEAIGRDLNGYSLEDVALPSIRQTPLDALDENNILDARGIRKITEITSLQRLLADDLRQASQRALVGRTATVASERLDERSGRASLPLDVGELIVEARSEQRLVRGSPVILARFDPTRNAFVVEPTHPS